MIDIDDLKAIEFIGLTIGILGSLMMFILLFLVILIITYERE